METEYGFLIERDGRWHVGMQRHSMIAAACLGGSTREDECRGYEWDPEHGARVQPSHEPFPATSLIVQAEEEAAAFLATARGRRVAQQNFVSGCVKTKDAWAISAALCFAKLSAANKRPLVEALARTKDAAEIAFALRSASLSAANKRRLEAALAERLDAEL